jgi:hypothetical protein
MNKNIGSKLMSKPKKFPAPPISSIENDLKIRSYSHKRVKLSVLSSREEDIPMMEPTKVLKCLVL